MKSGGPWNLRGLRPEARAAVRDAARRSGMSVGEWLNTVIEPTEAEDDETWRSADAEERSADRSVRRSREEFRDREARRQPEPSRRPREDRSDEPHRKGPQDDDRMFEQDRDRLPRHREREPDEGQWRARTGESEPRTRHRNRGHRFRDREADESQSQFVPASDESYERHRDRRERRREWEPGNEPEWRPRDQDRDFRRPDAPPRRYRDRGFDDSHRLNSAPDDLPRRWEADAEWSPPSREERPYRDERPVGRELVHHAARYEQSRLAEQQELTRRAEQQEQSRLAEQQELSRRGEQQEQMRRLRDEQTRAERQRREREIFERAAASAAAEQRRQNSIDQAVAEIAARQQALDHERAIESARESVRSWGVGAPAAAAPVLRESPPHVPQQPEPEIRRPAAPEPERVFAPWPEGWRSHGPVEMAHAVPEAPRGMSETSRTPETSRVAPEPSIDISGLQEQLREMTARIEALRPSNELEKAIVGLRADLAEVSRSFTEALPRRALESLEIEVKALGQRIDRSRHAGVDSTALAGVEHGLAEVREALRGLMPAEGLAGFDGALKAIATKVDAIGAKDDPAALQQLEAAMEVLRGMISRVASDEALTKVAEDVRALSAKVDHVAGGGSNVPTLAALESRIDILASALNASSDAGHAVPRELEKLLSGLVEKLEWVQLTHTDRTALSHLEDRIAALVKRLDASDLRLGLLEGVERGLADLLVYIEQLRGANNAGTAAPAAQPSLAAPPVERADAASKQTERSKQAERPKPTEQFGIVSVHDDLFEDPQGTTDIAAEHAPSIAPERRSERPNTAFAPPLPQAAASVPQPLFGRYEDHLQTDVASTGMIAAETTARLIQMDSALARPAAARTPIDPSLPPDHPLEPGSTSRSRAERIATAEAVSEPKPPVIPDPGAGKPDFIAAARRAAQAASVGSAQGKNPANPGAGQPKKLTERLRTLAVAAAVVVIVVGGFHIISRLFEDGSGSSTRIDVPSGAPPSQTEPPRTQSPPPQAQPEAPARKEPPHVEAEPQPPANTANSLSPFPLPGDEASQKPVDQAPGAGSISPPAQAPGRREGRVESRAPETAPPVAGAPMDITGSLPNPPPAASAPAPHAAPSAPAMADRLPAAIGGSTLRLAAVAGDPLAAYEVGVRFSEGRGVPASNEEAARWFEIAAKKGIVPAQFRLGTLYEKGLGVKKDLIAARDLYRAAAEKGHGKAMHNLAVIYAEGPDGKPDYATAAQWFRKAADHGVTDSQYNLAILYARGVGVEQNLAESYKWFFLAAKEGDQDAAQKRDEIASRIDRAALAAARAAAESWTAIPQPAEAITVKGVWDPPQSSQPAAKPKPRSAKATPRDVSKVN
jgi:localization factor PodJL